MTTTEIATVDDELETELAAIAVETVVGELVSPLTESQAKALDEQIRAASDTVQDNMDALLTLINEAAAGQIWVALGLPSLSVYLKTAVRIVPEDRSERKALSQSLAGKGFSERTIAAIVGSSQATVSRDLSDTPESLPDHVEGADGRTTKRQKTSQQDEPQEQPEAPVDVEEVPAPPEPVAVEAPPADAKPQPVSADFKDEMGYLANSVASFRDILDDDRFPKAAKTIAKRHLNKLQEHISALQRVVDCLMEVTP